MFLAAAPAAASGAEKLAAAGKSKDEIWNKTGLVKTKKGDWVYEVVDKPKAVNIAAIDMLASPGFNGPLTVKDILGDQRVLEKYPEIGMISVEASDGAFKGLYTSKESKIRLNPSKFSSKQEMIETLFHEVQHAVQDTEGRLKSPRAANDLIKDPVRFLTYNVMKYADGGEPVPESLKNARQLLLMLKPEIRDEMARDLSGFLYQYAVNEQEAYDTADRVNLGTTERAQKTPALTGRRPMWSDAEKFIVKRLDAKYPSWRKHFENRVGRAGKLSPSDYKSIAKLLGKIL